MARLLHEIEQLKRTLQPLLSSFEEKKERLQDLKERVADQTFEMNLLAKRLRGEPLLEQLKDHQFWRFRPLMRPLSGVKSMFIATKGDQKILLIGEVHQSDFCTQFGYIPIARIFEEYIRTYKVDFFLETRPNDLKGFLPIDTDIARKSVLNNYNTSPFKDIGIHEAPYVIDYIRYIASNVLRHRKQYYGRLHWVDPNIELTEEKYKTESVGNKLLHQISLFLEYNFDALSKLKLTDNVNEIKRLLGITITRKINIKDESERKKFATLLFKALGDSFFKKCFEDKTRMINVAHFVDILVEHTHTELHEECYFFFLVNRFLMDFYTICRLMKKENGWYKDIVIYAGNNHVVKNCQLLKLMGYRITRLDIKHNPRCTEKEEAANKARYS